MVVDEKAVDDTSDLTLGLETLAVLLPPSSLRGLLPGPPPLSPPGLGPGPAMSPPLCFLLA